MGRNRHDKGPKLDKRYDEIYDRYVCGEMDDHELIKSLKKFPRDYLEQRYYKSQNSKQKIRPSVIVTKLKDMAQHLKEMIHDRVEKFPGYIIRVLSLGKRDTSADTSQPTEVPVEYGTQNQEVVSLLDESERSNPDGSEAGIKEESETKSETHGLEGVVVSLLDESERSNPDGSEAGIKEESETKSETHGLEGVGIETVACSHDAIKRENMIRGQKDTSAPQATEIPVGYDVQNQVHDDLSNNVSFRPSTIQADPTIEGLDIQNKKDHLHIFEEIERHLQELLDDLGKKDTSADQATDVPVGYNVQNQVLITPLDESKRSNHDGSEDEIKEESETKSETHGLKEVVSTSYQDGKWSQNEIDSTELIPNNGRMQEKISVHALDESKVSNPGGSEDEVKEEPEKKSETHGSKGVVSTSHQDGKWSQNEIDSTILIPNNGRMQEKIVSASHQDRKWSLNAIDTTELTPNNGGMQGKMVDPLLDESKGSNPERLEDEIKKEHETNSETYVSSDGLFLKVIHNYEEMKRLQELIDDLTVHALDESKGSNPGGSEDENKEEPETKSETHRSKGVVDPLLDESKRSNPERLEDEIKKEHETNSETYVSSDGLSKKDTSADQATGVPAGYNVQNQIFSRISEILEEGKSKITEILEEGKSKITEILEEGKSKITEILEEGKSKDSGLFLNKELQRLFKDQVERSLESKDFIKEMQSTSRSIDDSLNAGNEIRNSNKKIPDSNGKGLGQSYVTTPTEGSHQRKRTTSPIHTRNTMFGSSSLRIGHIDKFKTSATDVCSSGESLSISEIFQTLTPKAVLPLTLSYLDERTYIESELVIYEVNSRGRRKCLLLARFWMVTQEMFSNAIAQTALISDIYYTVIYPTDCRMNLYLPCFTGGYIYEKDVIDDRLSQQHMFNTQEPNNNRSTGLTDNQSDRNQYIQSN